MRKAGSGRTKLVRKQEEDRDGAGTGRLRFEVSAETWEPDPDVPGTEMHELVRDGTVWAG